MPVVVADPEDASLRDVPPAQLLDALTFVSPGKPFRDVMVAGDWALRDGRSFAADGGERGDPETAPVAVQSGSRHSGRQ